MPRRKGCICTRFCTGDHNTPTDPKRFWECCNCGLEAETGAEYVKNRKPVVSLSKLLECEPSFLDTLKAFPFNGRTSLRAFNKNKVVKELVRQFEDNPARFKRFQELITARRLEIQGNANPEAQQENEDDNSNAEEVDDSSDEEGEDADDKSFLERAMVETDSFGKGC